MKTSNEKCCEKCKYYYQHYGIEKPFRVYAVHCGHCSKKDKKAMPNHCCIQFEQGETNFLVDKSLSIIEILNNISNNTKRLNDDYTEMMDNIKAILKF